MTHVPDLYTKKELRTSTAYNEGWGRLRSEKGLVTYFNEPDSLTVVWAFGNPLGSGCWHSDQLQYSPQTSAEPVAQ